jgi:Coiled stalk of trimeric autotransporter adhesin
MSRNGSRVYSLPTGNPVTTGTTISSTWANNTLADIATALTGSLAADGQTTATGVLQMGSNKISGLANGTLSTDAVNLSQLTSAVSGLGTMSLQNANSVAITGGAIDGTSIGATTRADGKFTTLDVSSTLGVTGVATFSADSVFNSTGAIKIPVGTTAQQPTPATGMIRYNSTLGQFQGYYASAWASIGGGATGGGSDQVFVLNDQTVTVNYTIPTGKNASSAGPITINTGITVTVPDNSTWVIV